LLAHNYIGLAVLDEDAFNSSGIMIPQFVFAQREVIIITINSKWIRFRVADVLVLPYESDGCRRSVKKNECVITLRDFARDIVARVFIMRMVHNTNSAVANWRIREIVLHIPVHENILLFPPSS